MALRLFTDTRDKNTMGAVKGRSAAGRKGTGISLLLSGCTVERLLFQASCILWSSKDPNASSFVNNSCLDFSIFSTEMIKFVGSNNSVH